MERMDLWENGPRGNERELEGRRLEEKRIVITAVAEYVLRIH